jgi:cobalt-precorrin 5A hydrolase
MGLDETMIVAGVGCRKGATAKEIITAISRALHNVGLSNRAIDVIATPAAKIGEPGIVGAASTLQVPLVPVSQSDLEAAGPRTRTRSERAIAVMGVPSVAEAAALAAAGPSSSLLAARIAAGPATCALAETGGGR